MKILFHVKCVCGHEFDTSKINNVQCRECGERFDINPPDNIPPICPVCGGIIIGVIGSTLIVCNECKKDWDLA